MVAGSYVALTSIGGSVSTNRLSALQLRITKTKTKLESSDPAQIATVDREALLGDMFYAGSLGYFAQYTALTHISGLQSKARQGLMPSIGTYGYVPKVDYFFGFPRAIQPGGIEMDLDSVTTFTESLDGDHKKVVNFVQQTGTLSSALEHAVPEQMFTTDPLNPPNAVSAVKALSIANSEGQRIYQITPANQASILGNIRHDKSTMDEIRAALAVGKTVITHTDAISVPGWTGAGYIILDPETGEGAYKIGGGSNGGFFLFWGTIIFLAIVILIALFSLSFIGLFFGALAFASFIDRVNKMVPLTNRCMEKRLNS